MNLFVKFGRVMKRTRFGVVEEGKESNDCFTTPVCISKRRCGVEKVEHKGEYSGCWEMARSKTRIVLVMPMSNYLSLILLAKGIVVWKKLHRRMSKWMLGNGRVEDSYCSCG